MGPEAIRDAKAAVQNHVTTGVNEILAANSKINELIAQLDQKISHWESLERMMKEEVEKVKEKVTLDVGGTLFTTRKDTLLIVKNTFFWAMLHSGHFEPDEKGVYFIDRSPKLFHHIIDFLRSGDTSFYQTLTEVDKGLLRKELDYYMMHLPNINEKIASPKKLVKRRRTAPEKLVKRRRTARCDIYSSRSSSRSSSSGGSSDSD